MGNARVLRVYPTLAQAVAGAQTKQGERQSAWRWSQLTTRWPLVGVRAPRLSSKERHNDW